MQSTTKETVETNPTELPQARIDGTNPTYQNHIPQFGVGGGIQGVFQYTTPEARPKQTTLTPNTLTEQRAHQERVLQTIQDAEQAQQAL